MADLVRVKEKFQVTIPVSLRRQLSLQQGDYLEATVSGNGIVLRPKRMVEAETSKPQGIIEFLMEPHGRVSRTREEIDQTLALDRGAWDK